MSEATGGVVVAAWNVEWAPRSRRTAIRERIAVLGADVLCPHGRTEGGTRVRGASNLAYLEILGPSLARRGSRVPLVVLGDFNQKIPRARAPHRVVDALAQALGDLTVATAGIVPGVERQVVDHIAHSPGLRSSEVTGFGAVRDDGQILSDHAAVRLRLDPARR